MWLFEKKPCSKLALIHVVIFVSFSSSNAHLNASTVDSISVTKQTPPPCVCVPYYYCDADRRLIADGQGLIDIRNSRLDSGTEATCDDYLEICCRFPEPRSNSTKCGRRHHSSLQHFLPRLDKDVASEGEFPWMVTILRTESVQQKNVTIVKKVYQCQGTLINERIVLTTAQCVWKSGNETEPLTIRAGQVDTMQTNEENTYQERNVQKVIVPKGYNSMKLRNNVALLVLRNPVTIQRRVDITCLVDDADIIDEDKCLVVGWDRFVSPEDAKTQRSQTNMLKRRLVPYVARDACNEILRETPLGRHFALNNCSICAGGSPGNNFCSGETGGSLSCPLKSEPSQYVQVGIASWCINVGNLPTPSIFTSILDIRSWIDNQMAKLKLDSSVYRASGR